VNSNSDFLHAQLFAKAASDFRKGPDWVNGTDIRFINHFNKFLGKCLVKVVGANIVQDGQAVLEGEHVYDAFENLVLGGRITTKKIVANDELKVLGVLMVTYGKIIREADAEEI
jgi:hypothetical protein